jgi:hypothetical protein
MTRDHYEREFQEALDELKDDLNLLKSKFSIVDRTKNVFNKYPVALTVILIIVGVYLSKKRGLKSILKMSSIFTAEKLLEYPVKKYFSGFLNKSFFKGNAIK